MNPVFSGINWSNEFSALFGMLLASVFLGLFASTFAIIYNKIIVPAGGAIEYGETETNLEKVSNH